MAEVHQVPEFGPMSGSTGKRKKYKKLVLGAAVRTKLASAMLAPLLALGATGLITLAVVEESTMNVIQDPPPAYSWDDGGGQQEGNPPAPGNPKEPEKPKEPKEPVKKPPSSPPPSSPPPSSPPPSSPPPSSPPPSSPPPSSPPPSSPPPSSPAAPVYYNDDSGEPEPEPPFTEPALEIETAYMYRIMDMPNTVISKYSFNVDPGDAESVSVTVTADVAGSSVTKTNYHGPYSGPSVGEGNMEMGYQQGDSTELPGSFSGRLTFVVTYEQNGVSKSRTYIQTCSYP